MEVNVYQYKLGSTSLESRSLELQNVLHIFQDYENKISILYKNPASHEIEVLYFDLNIEANNDVFRKKNKLFNPLKRWYISWKIKKVMSKCDFPTLARLIYTRANEI